MNAIENREKISVVYEKLDEEGFNRPFPATLALTLEQFLNRGTSSPQYQRAERALFADGNQQLWIRAIYHATRS